MGNLPREGAEQGGEVTRCWGNGVGAGPSAAKGINFSFIDVLSVTPFNSTEFTSALLVVPLLLLPCAQ